jgi:hypothetical protein
MLTSHRALHIGNAARCLAHALRAPAAFCLPSHVLCCCLQVQQQLEQSLGNLLTKLSLLEHLAEMLGRPLEVNLMAGVAAYYLTYDGHALLLLLDLPTRYAARALWPSFLGLCLPAACRSCTVQVHGHASCIKVCHRWCHVLACCCGTGIAAGAVRWFIGASASACAHVWCSSVWCMGTSLPVEVCW